MHVKSAYVLLPATGNHRTGHNVMDKMTYKFDVVMNPTAQIIGRIHEASKWRKSESYLYSKVSV